MAPGGPRTPELAWRALFSPLRWKWLKDRDPHRTLNTIGVQYGRMEQRTLAGYSVWGRKESDTTERTHTRTRKHAHARTHTCTPRQRQQTAG